MTAVETTEYAQASAEKVQRGLGFVQDKIEKDEELATAEKLESIAFPAISCGVYRYPLEQASRIAVRTVAEICREHAASVKRAVFCCFGAGVTAAYRVALEELEPDA